MNHNSVKTEKLVNLDVKLLAMVLYALREVSRKYGLEEKDVRDLELATIHYLNFIYYLT